VSLSAMEIQLNLYTLASFHQILILLSGLIHDYFRSIEHDCDW
jgi:HD superfamily phosphodiesterase